MGHAHGIGGAQTAFRKLVEACALGGYPVRTVALNDGEPLDSPTVAQSCLGVVPLSVNTPGKRLTKFFSLLVVRRKARAWRPTVAVAVGLNHSTRFVARGLCRGCFRIAQDFIHGRAANDPALLATAKVFHGLAVQAPSTVAALNAAGFSACSVDWLPCFPMPPEAGVCRAAPRVRETVRLGYFGRLAANKGLPMLAMAFSRAKFSRPVRLDIWGEGAEMPALNALLEKEGMASIVSLRGAYPSGRAGAELMAGYDGITLTSTGAEGLPLVLLEAMAYGLPILATDVGAIRDCCLNNPDAILVAPDLESVCGGLGFFVRNILSDRFDSDRVRRYYETHFSHSVMFARWQTCLDDPGGFFGRS